MTEQIQTIFFSKDNISNLNKILLQQTNKQNVSRDDKQKIINILIKNMKIIYKQIDISKINPNNFNDIFTQFKNHTLTNTINEINNEINNEIKIPTMNKANTPSELKFHRDFNSNPNNGNKLMERPTATKQTELYNQQNNYNISQTNSNNDFNNVFKPIVNKTETVNFNNYTEGKNKDDIKSLMSNIQQSRQTELNSRNQRPPMPDFLKPMKTSNKEETVNIKNDNDFRVPTNQKLDFKTSTSDQFNQGFQGLSNDIGGDLFSLDNIDKPLIEEEMVEDNSSFEDRLKKIQSERGNISINNSGQKIDFTSENFPKTNIGDNSFKSLPQQPQEQQLKQTKQQTNQMQLKQEQIKQQQQIRQQQEQQQIRQQQQEQQQIRQQEQEQQQQKQQQIKQQQIKQQEQQIKQQQMKQQEQKQQQMKQQEQKQQQMKQQEQQHNIIPIRKQPINNKNILDNEEYILKIKELEEIIRNNNEEIDELKNNTDLIKFKEELEMKENELKQLITKHEYLFNSNYAQLEIFEKSKSSYRWNFQKTIDNVMGIKLMSYSLPQPRFNINKNNNTLSLRINNNVNSINITYGKYTIDELISILNNKLLSNDIKISINVEQKIIIESENNFDIINTVMSKEILGFTNQYNNNNNYISDNVWDLRIDDKVYLYLNNLSDNPFGVLYFNGLADLQFKFQEPFDLDYLDIIFKDNKGREYDFNNLSHSLSFVIHHY